MSAYDQTRAAPRVLALAAFTAMATLAGVTHATEPGTLANPGFEGQPMKSLFFFAGEARAPFDGPLHDGPNGPLLPASNWPCKYSLFPKDGITHGLWSRDPALRDLALNGILGTGTNVVNMSYWGPPDTDIWGFYAPMQTAQGAHDQLFDAVAGKPLLIAPYIEDYDATIEDPDPNKDGPVVQTGCAGELGPTGQSPAFKFADDFPGTLDNPAPELVRQIVGLVNRYLVNPRNPAWKKKWAQMYDRHGEPRYIVALIHVGSNQQPPPSPDDPHAFDRTFAMGFGWVAREVEEQTGVRVGFTLDLLPPEHPIVTFKASVEYTAPELANEPSVLAVQAFLPELHTGRCKPVDHCDDEVVDESDETHPLNQMIEWKHDYISSWANAADGSIPVILDVSAGYDAHRVFEGPDVSRYGNNDRWRAGQKEMLSLRVRGVTGNAWNAYTEGSAIVPHCAFPHDLPSPGVPTCDDPASPYPELRTTYDWFSKLVPAGGNPARLASTLTSIGPTAGAYGDRMPLKFKLTQGMIGLTPPENAIIPLPGKSIRISFGDRTPVPGTTDDNGIVTAFIELDQQPAATPVPLVATFDGDDAYLSIEAAPGFVVTKEKTLVRWFSGQNAQASVERLPLRVTLAAILAEDEGPVLTGKTVSFTVGTGANAPGCTGATDPAGIARCPIPISRIPRGDVTVFMKYDGDAYYELAESERHGPLLPGCTPPRTGECPD